MQGVRETGADETYVASTYDPNEASAVAPEPAAGRRRARTRAGERHGGWRTLRHVRRRWRSLEAKTRRDDEGA